MSDKFPEQWKGFIEGKWSSGTINVRDFILRNYLPMRGRSFLEGPTERTPLWEQVMELSKRNVRLVEFLTWILRLYPQ